MLALETEHGPALLWWDSESDPSNPGWLLRYHLEPEGSPDALGRRHLDEPLDADIAADDEQAALAAALDALIGYRVGGGRRLTSAGAAELAGLKDAASWRAAKWRPDPGGRHDHRTPWWWETTVLAAMAARPGRGTRTDLS